METFEIRQEIDSLDNKLASVNETVERLTDAITYLASKIPDIDGQYFQNLFEFNTEEVVENRVCTEVEAAPKKKARKTSIAPVADTSIVIPPPFCRGLRAKVSVPTEVFSWPPEKDEKFAAL
jgi:hypothetical protein